VEIKAKTRRAASKPAKATVKSKVASSKAGSKSPARAARVVQASRVTSKAPIKSQAKAVSKDREIRAAVVRAANADIYERAKLWPASAGFFLIADAMLRIDMRRCRVVEYLTGIPHAVVKANW